MNRARRPLLPLLGTARQLFSYTAESGWITRKALSGGQIAGSSVGTQRKDGYLCTRIRGGEVLCHRLAWLLHHEEEPPTEIDHINGDRADNRIANLRPASRQENNQNRRHAHSNNRLGVMGVHRIRSGRYAARIRVGGKAIHIGVFDSSDQASEAYVQAKRELHKGNTL